MGANAQTSVPTFTAGEVLTAANMNISARTGIPVFVDTTARDAAFGGTGEKTLAEGQFAYIEATNTTQYYDGAAWQAVGASSGLTFITGATFTTVASVSFASGVFTSTYTNYLVVLNTTASSAIQTLSARVNAAGVPKTTSNYYGARFSMPNSGASELVATNSGTSYSFGALNSTANTYPEAGFTINVYQPAVAAVKTTVSYNGFNNKNAVDNVLASTVGGFLFDATEAHDGLTFLVGGTMTGFYKVYGIANS